MATATPALTIEVTPDAQVLDVTSEMFFQMIEAGVFPPERRVFLWAGRLYEKMAKTPAHATTSVRIADTLRPHLPTDWLIWPENPIALDARHASLPDVTVVRGPLERYHREDRHPQIGEVGLLVEIAVTSLPRDLTLRAETFARALVPAYWVADVQGHRIIEHTAPQIVGGVGSYARVQPRGLRDKIHLELDGREVAAILVADLIW
jgi:Uma2 family endonuclease